MAVHPTRRQVLAGGTALGWFLVAGRWSTMSAAAAEAADFTPQVLNPSECETLRAIADALVPGAASAGIAAYIDSQLHRGSDSLLIAKYLGVPTTGQIEFYRAALDNAARYLALPAHTVEQLVANMATDTVPDWQGPPASYCFFVLRADALDVTYGTTDGFAALDIPYMAHIRPETPW